MTQYQYKYHKVFQRFFRFSFGRGTSEMVRNPQTISLSLATGEEGSY